MEEKNCAKRRNLKNREKGNKKLFNARRVYGIIIIVIDLGQLTIDNAQWTIAESPAAMILKLRGEIKRSEITK